MDRRAPRRRGVGAGRIRSAGRPVHLFDPPDFACDQANLDAMGVRCLLGQDALDHALGKGPAGLMVFLHD
jgi:hypothetical protein